MSTSPVKCSHFTLGNPKKSFSTALFIHTSDCLPYHRRNTHTQLFNSLLSKTTWIGRYQMKQSPRHTLPDHQTSFINFHLVRSTASSLFSLCACQSFSTTSVRVLFGLSLGSWTLYFILHTFFHPTIIFFSQHMPMPLQPAAVIPMLCHLFLISLSQLFTWKFVF